MRDDLVDLVQDAAAAPLQQPDFDAMVAKGRRQRTTTQVIGGTASALVLLVAGVVLWPSTPAESPVISDGPADRADGELAELPDSWQWVQVGRAQFGIPGDWQVVDTTEEIAAHCSLYYTTPPMALTGPAPAPISCPAPDVTHPGPGLRATTLTDSSGMTPPADADTVDVNGWAAQRWTGTRTTEVNGDIVEGQFAVYRVDALDLYIKVRTDSAPSLADQIMATLSSIAGTPSTQAPSEGGGGEPYDVDAQMRPDLMEVTPDPAAPGETVELTFPEETSRGLGFVLERRLQDGSWHHVYFLTVSPAGRPDIPPQWSTAEERPGWDDLGVGGPGPDRAVIPETAEPGDYRICTANAVDEFCTPLRIDGETGVPPVPTPAELQQPYEPLFAGLPAPKGDGVLVATDSRIDGLGAFVAPGQPLPLDQPNAVQDAPADATFTVVLRDADTGEMVAEVTPDTPPGASFHGPTTGPISTRYVIEATLRDGDQTTSWTDAAVVTDLTVNVDIALTGVAEPGGRVEFVLVNRGTAGVGHGVGYQLDQLVDGSWVQVQDPPVKAMGRILEPASLSEPLTTGPLPGSGHYRLITETLHHPADEDGPAERHTVSLEFTARQ